jgi:sporulation protein YlmC with PRC-barrel domain
MRLVYSFAALAGLIAALPAVAAETLHDSDALRANKVIGLAVRNSSGEKLGDIQDLVIDSATGKIRYAALEHGGFLGIGEKLFAVPWDDLKLSVNQSGRDMHFVLNVPKEALGNAPGFDKNNWPSFADRNFTDKIDKFYNEHRAAGRTGGSTMRR